MRKILLIILLAGSFFPKPAFSQYRITLDSLNTYQYFDNNTYAGQYAYLINFPIRAKIDTLFVEDKMSIPVNAYLNFLSYLKVRTLIIEQHHKSKYTDGFKEYIINSRYRIDSLTGSANKLFNYKELPVYKPDSDSVLVYYTEETGSSCCPMDPKYNMQSLYDFIQQFQIAYKVKIGGHYFKSIGKEGEHIDYLTLEGLMPLQKIKFMDERIWSIIPNKDLKSFGEVYTIYMPAVIAKNDVEQL